MKILLIQSTLFLLSLNSINVADCNNEAICHLFENDIIEFNRNVNMGILCHTYNFNKIKFYELDTRSEFIDYLDKTKSMITDRPTMTFISIISYYVPNIKIIKSDVQKIMQFIISPEYFNEYPKYIKNLYKIEIVKINPTQEKKDLFNLLPDFNNANPCSHAKLTQDVFNIFLLEDIKNNYHVKNILRKEIEKFFFLTSKKNKETVMMKIVIIEAIKLSENNLVDIMKIKFNSNPKLIAPTNHVYFVAFELLENSNSYFQNNIELKIQRDSFEEDSGLTNKYYLHDNKSSLLLYKKPEINNLDYYIKFFNRNIIFEFYKFVDTNDTYTKLLHFLGYDPLKRSYGIKILMKSEIKNIHFFEINVLIFKKIIKPANNQIPEISNNIKRIIVSRINNDDSHNMIIDYNYEMDTYCSDGFPLSNVEREKIQDKEYDKNTEAKKLINFIDFYESFMFGRNYCYFKSVYSGNIDFNYGFCFYKREIWYKNLNILQIYKTLENSHKFQTDMDLRKSHKTFSSLKRIEVYEFTRKYTKNKYLIDSHGNIEVLKGFENHNFFDIELRFYSNIQLVKFFSSREKKEDLNYFIKVDFGFNKNYFIFFREVPDIWTNNVEFYNIIEINNEAKIILKPFIKELLYLDDDNEAEKYTLNFIGVIFNVTKTYLNDNLEVRNNLCYNLRTHLHFFFPRTHKLIYTFLDVANNAKTQFSQRIVYLITELFQTSIIIIKRNFKNSYYEACVLRSISNISDNSQEILESLL